MESLRLYIDTPEKDKIGSVQDHDPILSKVISWTIVGRKPCWPEVG